MKNHYRINEMNQHQAITDYLIENGEEPVRAGFEATKALKKINEKIIVVSFGGGTNSTAMLCGFVDRGIVPQLILFADTGAEMPHTYEHVRIMEQKIREWWGIDLITVRAPKTIVEHCEKTRMLPSLAYGHRSCSQKFKHEPMEKYIKQWASDNGISSIIKCIGYDSDEGYRTKGKPTEKELKKGLVERYWYPLVEWGWRRNDCIATICKHGIPQPGKSACFFCPASKRSEVVSLAKNHPELIKKALEIEEASQNRHRTKIGLGGIGNLWSDWLAMDEAQSKLMLDIEPNELPCGCLDG